jgi:hypothetical protein
MKKTFSALFAIITVCALAFTASAAAAGGESNHLSVLVSSALKLAFETDNVTLTAKARFSLNGELFKTLDGTLKQDGYNSYLKIMLDTPKSDGTVYTGGYTVVGEGDTAYSMETYNGPYYQKVPLVPANTVIRKTAVAGAAAKFADQFAELLGSDVEPYITVAEESGVQRYKVSLAGNQIPAAMNTAFNLVTAAYAPLLGSSGATVNQVSTVYENWDELFAFYYQKVTGKVMPKGFIEDAMAGSESSYAVYKTVAETMDKETGAAAQEHTRGVVYFRSNGQAEWYDTYTEYMRSAHLAYTYYSDADAAFRAFYQQQTGKELTGIDLKTIQSSTNEALNKAYSDMWDKMDTYYKAIALADAKAVAIRVDGDGSYKLLNTVDEPTGMTVTREITGTLSEIKVSSVACEFTLNTDHNLLSANGDIVFAVTDTAGAVNTLGITFSLAASAYGETSVAAFDPKDYGVTNYDEYTAGMSASDTEQVVYPETVIFDGVEYLSQVYSYYDGIR